MNLLFICIPLCLVSIVIGWFIRWTYAKFKLTSIEQKAVRLNEEAIKEAEAKSKELLIETRDLLLKEQQQQEREARERRGELQKTERRLLVKEENLEKKQAELEVRKQELTDIENENIRRAQELEHIETKWTSELERVATMSTDEAKHLIIESMEKEAKRDAQLIINKIEQEAQIKADKIARDIIVTSIQRLATEVSSEVTVTTVSLPSDEMKGRIIGREGRNIRTLETLTGVDIIIDDTPEAVVISCFDPVRKEVARVALERLVQDGRIHPARIEEVVTKVTKEITRITMEEADKVLFDLGLPNMSQEMVRALGKLHFRTSYGQNVLAHAKEVAVLSGMIAAEVGADREIAVVADSCTISAKVSNLMEMPTMPRWVQTSQNDSGKTRASSMPFCLTMMTLNRTALNRLLCSLPMPFLQPGPEHVERPSTTTSNDLRTLSRLQRVSMESIKPSLFRQDAN